MNGRILDLAFVSESSFVELIDPPSSLLKVDSHHKPFVLRIAIGTRTRAPVEEADVDDFDFKRCDFAALNDMLMAVDC